MVSTEFGNHLRQWRQVRGWSQLDLASRAEVSQRHVSFLETGRSRPSPAMVIHLSETLDIPPREQNLLLLAAGHAPEYVETPLEELEEVSDVLDLMLEAHLPAMAIIVDRRWNLVRSNQAATTLTSLLFAEPPSWIELPLNVMRLNFHPEGLRSHMVDWESTAAVLLRRLARDVASHPHDRVLAGLMQEVLDYPGVSALPSHHRASEARDLVVPTTFSIAGEEVALFTTIAVIGDAHDLTLSELRLETFWPMDRASAERWNRLIGTTGLG